jgi:omega-amidase
MELIGLQIDLLWEAKAANHAKVRALLEADPPAQGSLVLLPEMFATGFSMNAAVTNDAATCETQDFLRQCAVDFGIFLLAGVVGKGTQGRPANQCLIFAPNGAELARYDKLHPFSLAGEPDHYAAGERVVLFPWGDFLVAPFICYDLRFPEIFRAAAAAGANLLTVIASWPEARTEHWIALLRARAIENQAYVVGINRCGRDPFFGYQGRSLIIDPLGTILADAGEGEGRISALPVRSHLDEVRRRLPFLRDRRGELPVVKLPSA